VACRCDSTGPEGNDVRYDCATGETDGGGGGARPARREGEALCRDEMPPPKLVANEFRPSGSEPTESCVCVGDEWSLTLSGRRDRRFSTH
jgi:hypothetical protein